MNEWHYNAELLAVNEVLSAVGESPINTLENPTNVDTITVIQLLRTVNRREQSRDWSFNKAELTLNPDTDTNTIPWSDTYLYLNGTNGEILKKRGGLVFDFTNQTNTFSSALTVDAIILVSFEEMPEAFRDYVIAKTASEYQKRYLNVPEVTEVLEYNVSEAWARLQEYEIDINQPNLLTSTPVQTLRGRT